MDDDELQRIREKKILELQGKMGPKDISGVIPVEQAGFPQLIEKNPFVVIDFWAEWCGPCRMVGPVIEELAREFGGKIVFGKCNTDYNQRIAAHYGITAIPTILLFSHGRMVDRVIGAYPKDALKSRIKRAFAMEVE